jgi:hypothetical protein
MAVEVYDWQSGRMMFNVAENYLQIISTFPTDLFVSLCFYSPTEFLLIFLASV